MPDYIQLFLDALEQLFGYNGNKCSKITARCMQGLRKQLHVFKQHAKTISFIIPGWQQPIEVL